LAAQISTPSWKCPVFYDDDDDEYNIQYKEYLENSSNAIASEEPDNSLSMGDEHLNTILETKSDEVINSSVEDLVLIPSEFEDTSRSDIECVLPSCDDFSPINVLKEESVTFSNLLLNSNDDFTSSDNELQSDEDVLEDIKCNDSYDSNLDELTFLVTPLSDSSKDEYFTPGDDVELLLHRDTSTPIMSVFSILEGFTDEPPLKENDDLFDLESKENKWKKILYDALINDLMTEDKVFNPRIHDQNFSPTYVSLPFEDHHYLFFIYVVRFFFLISLIRWILLFFSPSGVRMLFLTPTSLLFIFLIRVELS
nr:hypothetical protein [Tanacetum cinerariifolium]